MRFLYLLCRMTQAINQTMKPTPVLPVSGPDGVYQMSAFLRRDEISAGVVINPGVLTSYARIVFGRAFRGVQA